MNKIFIISMMVVVPSIAAMELDIQQSAKERFSQHLAIVTNSMNRMCTSGTISPQHSIKCSLDRLALGLKEHDGDIATLIKSQGLLPRIEKCRYEVESNPVVIFAQNQVSNKSGDVEYVKTFLKRTRFILAGLELHKKQPTYQNQWIGDVSMQDRVNFVVINSNYPSDEEAQKDYLATFIYQTLFVPQD